MRYASEFFVELGRKERAGDYRPFLKALARLQDQLGALHDLAAAETLMPSILAQGGQKTAFAAGLIVGRQGARDDKLIKLARKEARAFEEASLWW